MEKKKLCWHQVLKHNSQTSINRTGRPLAGNAALLSTSFWPKLTSFSFSMFPSLIPSLVVCCWAPWGNGGDERELVSGEHQRWTVRPCALSALPAAACHLWDTASPEWDGRIWVLQFTFTPIHKCTQTHREMHLYSALVMFTEWGRLIGK